LFTAAESLELRRNVGVEHYDVRALSNALGILAAHPLFDIILRVSSLGSDVA
jgi:hypothetical protein